jgi:hypothetical protein
MAPAAAEWSQQPPSVPESARMPGMTLPPIVNKRLESSFSQPERAEARQRLPSELPDGAPYERTLLAIIALSGGSLDALSQFSKHALRDWRDVRYWHENPRGEDEPKSWAELRDRLRLQHEDDSHGT